MPETPEQPAADQAAIVQAVWGPHAWNRQDGESARAYRGFLLYAALSLERSSIVQAYRESEARRSNAMKAASRWRDWSARYSWVERAAQRDDHEAHAIRASARE